MEVGKWRGLKREERKCIECDSGEVEDVKHFLMRCKTWNGEREELMEKRRYIVTGLDEVKEERRWHEFLTWHAEMSPSQKVWRNCGQRGLCRSKGRPGICIFPSHIHHLTLASDPHTSFDL